MKPVSVNPDARIVVRFLKPEESGRKADITILNYGCPLMVGGEGFDCRFEATDESVYHLGNTYDIPVKFLSPELALARLSVGQQITLWEGKTIAEGVIRWLRDKKTI